MPFHAVVIGGGIAGLLAARVLTDHVERVTLVERDHFPETASPRKGLPQSRHLHVLLTRGRMALEQLFPGIGDELLAAGAEAIDAAGDIAWLTPAGWGIRFPSDIRSFACSRPLLDHVLRLRVSAMKTLAVLEDTGVTGLRLSDDGKRLAGVLVGTRDDAGGSRDERVLHADLVVDAGGRGSRTPEWLASLSFKRPEETVVNAYLGYASRIYERPPVAPPDWKCLYVQAAPPRRTRGGVAFAVEGGRWIVTLGGIGGDYPPTEEAGFLDFMKSLDSRRLFEVLEGARPLSPIVGYRATENRWRHYERAAPIPEGLLVMGDAACTFNPVYGQGMTLAALAALGLGESLAVQRARSDGALDGLSARFQRRVAQINRAPWLLATSEDFRSPRFDGPRPGVTSRLMHLYLDRVIAQATHDKRLRRTFLAVLHMIEAPSALFRPGILARVLCRPLPPGAPS